MEQMADRICSQFLEFALQAALVKELKEQTTRSTQKQHLTISRCNDLFVATIATSLYRYSKAENTKSLTVQVQIYDNSKSNKVLSAI